MTDDDAKYIAKTLTVPQREIVVNSNKEKITSLKNISEKSGIEYYIVKHEASYLEAMNLLEVKRSRSDGQFYYNCAILNDRGIQVQQMLAKQKLKKNAPNQ
jgi:DNA-binding MarR family transcriptional regulator